MILLHILLLIFIDLSENSKVQNISLYSIYRIRMQRSTETESNKVILVNFFGLPGIQVLDVNSRYTDVKIPRRYNSAFRHLEVFKNNAKLEMLDQKDNYHTKSFSVNRGEHRRIKYISENDDENISNDEEAENYINAPFRDYLDYKSIKIYIKQLQKLSDRVHILKIGRTSMNRTIYGVLIKSNIEESTTVFIEGGTIARDWLTISMALYVIKEFAINISAYPTLKHLDWIIIPLVNPDGYELSYRNKKFRLWEKNRNCFGKCTRGACGVNIDRNFPHYYGGIGASLAPCSHFYAGPTALSEPESRAMQRIMMTNRHNIKLYIGLRSFGAYILYPWGLKAEPIFDEAELNRVARGAATAMYESHKGKLQNYSVGNYAKIKYPAAGNIMDFARGVINIKYSYVIFLRGDGDGEMGYRPESTAIFHIVHECFQGIRKLAEHVDSRYPPSKSLLRKKRNKRKRHADSAFSIKINPAFILFIFFLYCVEIVI